MNNSESSNNNSREKILQAAIDEFNDNGYDGARVARISKKAGVSQALLYYNFTSKEAILDEIIQDFLNLNIEHVKTVAYPSTSESDKSAFSLRKLLHKSLDFILENQKRVNILLMQALTKKQKNKKILTLLGDVNRTTREKILSTYGYQINLTAHEKVIDYFFIFIPYIMFGALGKEWAEENGISMEEMSEAIIDAGETIYNRYLK